MKKVIVFISLIIFGLFFWFYKDNEPQRVTDKIQYQSQNKDTSTSSRKVTNQLQKTKTIRMPSSKKKTAMPNRTWKFKDHSRLPARHSQKKPIKKNHQIIRENIIRIQKEFFIDQNTLNTPAGDVFVSSKLKAINKVDFDQTMGTYYSEVNQHILFKNIEPISLSNFNPEGPSLVTLNKDSGKMGILTGKIVLVMMPEVEIDTIIDQYNLNMIYHSESIHTYYLELNQTGNLEAIISELRASNSVIRADLEIIDNVPVTL
ncbi:MAG: hypothetical protein HN576_04540 [Bacteriovoracaceae bacterium]|nr:hypothetical protein [Bacteriovoracaceae bacterium]